METHTEIQERATISTKVLMNLTKLQSRLTLMYHRLWMFPSKLNEKTFMRRLYIK